MSGIAAEQSARPASRWRALSWLGVALALFAGTRLALFFVAFAAGVLLPPNALFAARDLLPGDLWLNGWVRWEALAYLSLPQQGYWFDALSGAHGPTVLPLFPVVVQAATALVGEPARAALLVANVALALTLLLLYRLVAETPEGETAALAVLLLAVFPFGFVLSAAYPHSLALLLIVAAAYLVRRGWPEPAGLLAGLAALTHPLGLALWAALCLGCLRLPNVGRRRWPLLLASLAVAPLALAGFARYLHAERGLPLELVGATLLGLGEPNLWQDGPTAYLHLLSGPANGPLLLLLSLALLGLLATTLPALYRQLGAAAALFVGLGLALALVADPGNLGPWLALLWPAFVLLARWARQGLGGSLLLAGSAVFLALLTASFATGYWVDARLGAPPPAASAARVAAWQGELGKLGPKELLLNVADELLILSHDQPATQRAAPGETLALRLDLHVLRSTDQRYLLSLSLLDPKGQRTSLANALPDERPGPPRLVAGSGWRQQLALPLPRDLPTGIYELELRALQVPRFGTDYATPAMRGPRGELTSASLLGEVVVASAADLSTPEQTQPRQRLASRFGESLGLVGYDLRVAAEGGAQVAEIALYWQAQARQALDYTVFVQVLDASGKMVAQADSYPLEGRFPLSHLAPGLVLRDPHRLSWTGGAAPYRVIVGLYLLADMKRVPVLQEPNQAVADHVELGQLPAEGGR
ncbi:MAG: glycosyltransferase family 39 protein [Chloroflexota bacterium]